MPKITHLIAISSVQPAPGTGTLPDGTLESPHPYEAADVTFDDGVTVQVERPLTRTKIRNAHEAAIVGGKETIDGVTTGDVV